MIGPIIAVQPWPPLLVQAAWWADPATRRIPLAVVNEGGAIVSACADALRHGVAIGQTVPQARLHCPALTIVPPERAVAAELWYRTLSALLTLSPIVEAATHDDASDLIAYLDGHGLDLLWGDTRAVAHRAVRTLAAQGLAARAGAGPSRAVASALARRMDASGPRVLSAQESRAFLAALPLTDPLFALDAMALDDLRSLGLTAAGQLAALPHDDVVARFGPAAGLSWELARGGAEPPLRGWMPPERIAVECALDGAVDDRGIVDAALTRLCGELDARLRAAGRATELLSLLLTCEDAAPTLHCFQAMAPLMGWTALTVAAHALWTRIQPPAPVLALTLTAARLCPATARQETLFAAGAEAATERRAAARSARLAHTLQTHRAQFGPGRIRRPRPDPLNAAGWTWSEHEP